MKYNKFLEELEQIDSDHKKFSIETPLRDDAFEISDDEKISIIQNNVKEILQTLGMDMNDDSLKGTPLRVAKAYVKEIFGGLNPKNLPKASTFDNKYQYDEMLVEKLQDEGIDLARRTVAKYRELLNIPASSVRRKIMKIQNINI